MAQKMTLTAFYTFPRACVDFLHSQPEIPDATHIHDWETAAVAILIREPAFKERFAKTKVILTVHNFEYQGRCSPHNLDDIGLPSGVFQKQLQNNSSKDLNLIKGGIVYSILMQ